MLAVAVGATALAACGGDAELPTAPPLTTPLEAPLERVDAGGGELVLTAGFFERSMVHLQPRLPSTPADAGEPTVRWSSADPATVAVDATGRVRALRPGRAWVRVGDRNADDSVFVRVLPSARLPRVIAHRGFGRVVPENTLPAFQWAMEQGADAVELDLHLSRDGVFVVMHDETVDRTTDHSGLVREFTAAELGAMNACRQGVAGLVRCGVPTLGQALDLVRRLGGRVVLDIKVPLDTARARALVAEVERHQLLHRALFMTMDVRHSALLRAESPVAYVGMLAWSRFPTSFYSPWHLAAVQHMDTWQAESAAGDPLVPDHLAAGVEPFAFTLSNADQVAAMRRAGVQNLISGAPLPR